MKIVVTGCAGMIGSNLVSRLLDHGHEVVGIDNLWRGKIENLKFTCRKEFERLQLVIDDLSYMGSWMRCLKGVDCVVHLADVVAGIDFVFKNEAFLFRKNLLINLNVADAVTTMEVPRYIYIGTACSFPKELQTGINASPMREVQQLPANPESAYGWSKLMGEFDARYLHEATGIKTVVLALHNVYGTPCQYQTNRAQVIPATIYKALRSEDNKLHVWGTGEQGRAFVHVQDVVDAIVAALDKGENSGVIQIGPSVCTSVKEIAEAVNGFLGDKLELVYHKDKPMGDMGRCADYSKAKRLLGWSPRVDLRVGLEETFNWIKGQL